MLQKIPYQIYAVLLALLLPAVAMAQPQSIIANIGGCDFVGGQVTAGCVPALLAHVVKFIFGLAGAFALIMIMISGYQIALAKAMGRDRSEGVTRLRVAIIGFIMCAFSWFIIDFVIRSLAFGY